MTKLPLITTFVLATFASPNAFAAEQTVTLAVKNMDCAACPYTVKASLQAVSGVKQAVVSYKEKTAIVTYDDTKTDVKGLITATTNAGYPSAPRS
jgi:mercuric ion binding protein